MKSNLWNEKLVEKKVTYTLLIKDDFIIVENVPARVNLETGEQLFSPEIVERLQKTIWEKKEPNRIVKTQVFEFVS